VLSLFIVVRGHVPITSFSRSPPPTSDVTSDVITLCVT